MANDWPGDDPVALAIKAVRHDGMSREADILEGEILMLRAIVNAYRYAAVHAVAPQ